MEIGPHQAVGVDLSGLHLLFSSDSLHRQLSLFQSAKKEQSFESLVPNLKNANDIWCVGVKNWGQSGARVPRQRPLFSQRNIQFHLKAPEGSVWIQFMSHTSLWRWSWSPSSTWSWSRRKTQTKAWRRGHWSTPSPPPSALGQSTEPGPGSWRAQKSTKEDEWRSVRF